MLRLHKSSDNTTIGVNANHIDMISIHNDGSRIYFAGGSFIDIKETFEDVMEYLETGISPESKKKFDSLFED